MKVINKLGKGKGKRILILSGVHGNELTPVYTSYLLSQMSFNHIKVKDITILPTLNIHGIEQNTREQPTNSYAADINRALVFEDDKFSIDKLKKFIDISDVIIDLHSSPDCTEFVLLNQNEYTDSYVYFCEKIGLKYLIRYSNINSIKKYCLDAGKITFTVELNGIGKVHYHSAHLGSALVVNILENINKFKLIKGDLTNTTYIEYKSHHSGIFIPAIEAGNIIYEYEKLGSILNLKTFEITPIIFDKKGRYRVIAFNDTDYVSADIPICLLQKENENE